MTPELILSILAIIISGASASYSFKQGKRGNELQERIVVIEEKREQERLEKEKRAKLRAEFTYIPTNSNDSYREIAKQISIKNIGKQKARNVKIFVNGEPITAYRDIFCRPTLVIGNILDDNSQTWRIEVDEDSPETAEIDLRWDDSTGTNHEFKEKLSLKI